MIHLTISTIQLDRAYLLYDFGELNGSITKGKSNIYGAVGEVMVNDYFKSKGLEVVLAQTYDYDITINGHKIDVKTKRRTVPPQPSHLCSVAAFNTRQNCDMYFFVTVHENLIDFWLLGYINKSEFFNIATFRKKGEHDYGGWRFKADCFNLPINKLNNFR